MSGDIFVDNFYILPKPSWTPAGPQDIFVDIFWTFCQRPQRPPRNPPRHFWDIFRRIQETQSAATSPIAIFVGGNKKWVYRCPSHFSLPPICFAWEGISPPFFLLSKATWFEKRIEWDCKGESHILRPNVKVLNENRIPCIAFGDVSDLKMCRSAKTDYEYTTNP